LSISREGGAYYKKNEKGEWVKDTNGKKPVEWETRNGYGFEVPYKDRFGH
jgi:hypothetical protein